MSEPIATVYVALPDLEPILQKMVRHMKIIRAEIERRDGASRKA